MPAAVAALDDASYIKLFDTGSILKMERNGYVGAIKMTLHHDKDISLDMFLKFYKQYIMLQKIDRRQ